MSLARRLLVYVLVRVTPPCQEMTHLLSQQLDAPLPFWRRWQIRGHLYFCSFCLYYAGQLQALRGFARLLDNSAEEDAPPLPPETKARLQARLQQELNSDS